MNTDNYSQLKTRILDILWNETDFDAAVRRVLVLVGNEFSADIVYISEYSVSDSQLSTPISGPLGLHGFRLEQEGHRSEETGRAFALAVLPPSGARTPA